MALQHKSFKAVLLPVAADAPDGTMEAIVAVTNNVDRGRERIKSGFFTKSLARKYPKGVWGHDWLQPVAKTLAVEEWLPGDARLPDQLKALGGYYIKALFNLDTQRGREAYSDVKFGIVDEFSIGYDPTVTEYQAKEKVLDLVEGEWFEWSPVLVGMNAATALLSVKQLGGDYDAMCDLWDALDFIQIALSFVRQRQLLQSADADTLAVARGLVDQITGVIDDLAAVLPPEAAPATASAAALTQAKGRSAADPSFAATASMTVAVLDAFLSRAKRRAANRTKEGRTISAATDSRLADVETALAAAIPALQEALEDVQEVRAGVQTPDTDDAEPASDAAKGTAAAGRKLYLDFLQLQTRGAALRGATYHG